jgi:hypothetical protein
MPGRHAGKGIQGGCHARGQTNLGEGTSSAWRAGDKQKEGRQGALICKIGKRRGRDRLLSEKDRSKDMQADQIKNVID